MSIQSHWGSQPVSRLALCSSATGKRKPGARPRSASEVQVVMAMAERFRR